MFKAVADILSFGVRVFINSFILHLDLVGKKAEGKKYEKKRTKKNWVIQFWLHQKFFKMNEPCYS